MKRTAQRPDRALLETALAVASGLLAVLAAVWPDWIETFGVDPDHGSGALEWAVPAVLAMAALTLSALAHRHWRAWLHLAPTR